MPGNPPPHTSVLLAKTYSQVQNLLNWVDATADNTNLRRRKSEYELVVFSGATGMLASRKSHIGSMRGGVVEEQVLLSRYAVGIASHRIENTRQTEAARNRWTRFPWPMDVVFPLWVRK